MSRANETNSTEGLIKSQLMAAMVTPAAGLTDPEKRVEATLGSCFLLTVVAIDIVLLVVLSLMPSDFQVMSIRYAIIHLVSVFSAYLLTRTSYYRYGVWAYLLATAGLLLGVVLNFPYPDRVRAVPHLVLPIMMSAVALAPKQCVIYLAGVLVTFAIALADSMAQEFYLTYLALSLVLGAAAMALTINMFRARFIRIILEHRNRLEEAVEFRTKELQQAYTDVSAALRAKDEFMRTVTHELRTPLNGIIASADLFEPEHTHATQRELVSIIQSSSRHLLHVIDELLDYSRLESSSLHLYETGFDLRASLYDLEKMFQVSAAERGIQFEMEVDTRIPQFLVGDAARIRQILLNIVGNAIKFTAEGRVQLKVEFNSRTQRGPSLVWGLEFIVVDTGIGIDPQHQPFIFEPFFQGDPSVSRRFGGSGLGLSISKRLVELMGGHIEVTSKVGKGSQFKFTLYLHSHEADVDSTTPDDRLETEVYPSIFAGKRVLIAEDDPTNQRVASLQFRKLGIEPWIVSNGHEVIAACENQVFDVIYMDIQMPELDGWEATRMIRAQSDRPQPKIVAMSALCSDKDIAYSRKIGMDDFIIKPVGMKDIIRTLHEA